MAYTTHPNGAFLTRAGNYNVTKQVLDEKITLSRYIDTSTDNLTSGAFYKLWSVPTNFVVLEARVICHTAETTDGSDTVDIVDDDSSTTTFVSNGALATAGTVTSTNARKRYTADGFICMKPDHALATAKFFVVIEGIVLNTSM